MSKDTLPSGGGSYVREKDGSLNRVAETKMPERPGAKPKPAKAAAQSKKEGR